MAEEIKWPRKSNDCLLRPIPPHQQASLPPTPHAALPSVSAPPSSAQRLPASACLCILHPATDDCPLPPTPHTSEHYQMIEYFIK
jgi:hypothetical protein